MTPKQVIDFFGGVRATCKALGLTHQAIYYWIKVGRVSAGQHLKIHLKSNGKLK